MRAVPFFGTIVLIAALAYLRQAGLLWLFCLKSRWRGIEQGKVVEQQPVDKNVPTADLAKQEVFCGVVQKACVVPGCISSTPDKPSQDSVLDASSSTVG